MKYGDTLSFYDILNLYRVKNGGKINTDPLQTNVKPDFTI